MEGVRVRSYAGRCNKVLRTGENPHDNEKAEKEERTEE